MAHRVKTLLISAAARTLGWLSASEGGLRKIAELGAKPIFALGRLGFRFVFVPLYAVGYALKRALRRVANPAKNRVMFVMANRYVVHVLIIAIATATSAVSLYAREVRAENLGEQSILYKLVRGEEAELTEETAESTPTHIVSYFDPPAVEAQLDVDDITAEDSAGLATIGDAAMVQPNITETDVTPTGTRTKPETYVVQDGDTLSGIAKKFGVSINTILWENKLTPRDFLKPGQSLVILQTTGLTHTVAKGDTLGRIAARYGVTADDVIAANSLASADDLRVGEKLVVPGGQPPTPVVAVAPRPTLAAVRKILTVDRGGTPPPNAPASSGRMVWPTSWRVITQYYGWKHTGVDIDGDYNSPIYASEAGVVTHAGWGRTKGGYGYYIDMDHGGGIKTRYGHASKIFVNVGDQVAKGQTIAMVGTTGRSTGTHLHFEVMVNGKFTNPLQWVR
ncbi:LysM peptidoglycan-binding domain-containing protein [Patescibacteria group bacterium]|nr:MAG: LysM peptidoglycan-binding domain-containing protein [Patescibacteria group bacterium]